MIYAAVPFSVDVIFVWMLYLDKSKFMSKIRYLYTIKHLPGTDRFLKKCLYISRNFLIFTVVKEEFAEFFTGNSAFNKLRI